MRKQELAILEKAFSAEVEGALSRGLRMMQTRSKVAEKLADEGFLVRVDRVFGESPFQVRCLGYELTEAGRLAYCLSCSDEQV